MVEGHITVIPGDRGVSGAYSAGGGTGGNHLGGGGNGGYCRGLNGQVQHRASTKIVPCLSHCTGVASFRGWKAASTLIHAAADESHQVLPLFPFLTAESLPRVMCNVMLA